MWSRVLIPVLYRTLRCLSSSYSSGNAKRINDVITSYKGAPALLCVCIEVRKASKIGKRAMKLPQNGILVTLLHLADMIVKETWGTC